MTECSPFVLVVEDEPLVRLHLADLLGDAGFRVIEAASAAEALTVLQAGLPVRVLLTDVEMPPGISGYELARQVRQSWPEIEVLVLSGRAWPAEGDLPPGAAFLAKPCPNEAVIAHVRSAMNRAPAPPSPVPSDQEGPEEETGNRILPFPKTA